MTHATYGLLGEAKEDSVGGASLLGEDGDALAVWSKGIGSKCIQFFDAKSGQPVHTAHLAAQCKELVELPPTGEADEVFDAVSVSMQGLSLWRGYQQEGIVVKQVPLRPLAQCEDRGTDGIARRRFSPLGVTRLCCAGRGVASSCGLCPSVSIRKKSLLTWIPSLATSGACSCRWTKESNRARARTSFGIYLARLHMRTTTTTNKHTNEHTT